MEDRFDGAFGDARFAVDAVFWINVKHVRAFVKAVAGADHNAIGVLAA